VQEAKKKQNDSCILWSQAVRKPTRLQRARFADATRIRLFCQTQQGVNFAIQMEYSLMVANHAMHAFCNKARIAQAMRIRSASHAIDGDTVTG
jgi:hypothetical protein